MNETFYAVFYTLNSAPYISPFLDSVHKGEDARPDAILRMQELERYPDVHSAHYEEANRKSPDTHWLSHLDNSPEAPLTPAYGDVLLDTEGKSLQEVCRALQTILYRLELGRSGEPPKIEITATNKYGVPFTTYTQAMFLEEIPQDEDEASEFMYELMSAMRAYVPDPDTQCVFFKHKKAGESFKAEPWGDFCHLVAVVDHEAGPRYDLTDDPRCK